MLRIAVAAATLAFPVIGCGPGTAASDLARYEAAIREALGADAAAPAATGEAFDTQLPRRRDRRIATGEQRIGPRDFLATLGCPLSELVAARNGPLGKVLEPTRRLSHEQAVLRAGRECLPGLPPDRAATLAARLDAKQAELGAHVWNAVWLDAELERFLTAGTPALIGGESTRDAERQLARAARALAVDAPAAVDVVALEAAFEQLRDDPALGPLLRQLDAVRAGLTRTAARVAPLAGEGCSPRARRAVRAFEAKYLPIQPALAALDRRGGELLAPLGRIYRASARGVEAPAPMARFAGAVLDMDAEGGLWQRYRAAWALHGAAWQPLLEACGVLPGADA